MKLLMPILTILLLLITVNYSFSQNPTDTSSLEIVLESNNASCTGSHDGEIHVTANGGVPFLWDKYIFNIYCIKEGGNESIAEGVKSARISVGGITAGYYEVEVQDSIGTIVKDTVHIETNSGILLSKQMIRKANTPTSSDGKIEIEVALTGESIVENWGFEWLTSENLPIPSEDINNRSKVENLSAGFYHVRIYDVRAFSCEVVKKIKLTYKVF